MSAPSPAACGDFVENALILATLPGLEKASRTLARAARVLIERHGLKGYFS
ncbi:hypothetical protein ACTWPT_42875 [Nonomuraea sp. 3N208]|uniref:hypothetical protein n=1 Tax=Nonomuraea sp. 3N208 TaxID=3457421 RepID=UPI003FD35798